MSYLEKRLQADAEAISDCVWSLGAAVEAALKDAKRLLVHPDPDSAYKIVLGDHAINRDSRKCDRMCHAFIARHLPSAGHLRRMAATIRVNVALERMGDYAVTIARESVRLGQALPEKFLRDMDEVADAAITLLGDARQAFRDGNADVALATIRASRKIQSRMDRIYDDLAAADNDLDGWTMLVIFVVFSLFKRVADQAKNIADQTIYAVQGIDKMAKQHRVLFLDQTDSGMGQMAVAIGRKKFSAVADFAVATPERSDLLPSELRDFLIASGLDTENLDTELLETLRLDLSDYGVIVSLEGHYRDYIDQVPFHTSALNWPVGSESGVEDRMGQYRSLVVHIEDLMKQIAGEQLEKLLD